MKIRWYIATLVIILTFEAILTSVIPHSKGYLFELLGAKSGPIWLAIGLFFFNYLLLEAFQSFKPYWVIKVSTWFRDKRTTNIVKSGVDQEARSVPQRIQEDVKLSYFNRITVWAEYFVSGTILVHLVFINLSEPILVIGALGYAAVSVGIAYFFNPRLTKAEKEEQQAEATFRESLTDKLCSGLMTETNKIVLRAGWVRTQYLLFTKLQTCIVITLPYVVLVPALISGSIDLGELMKHQSTFALIVVNAAILIQYYTILIKGKASEERIKKIELK